MEAGFHIAAGPAVCGDVGIVEGVDGKEEGLREEEDKCCYDGAVEVGNHF